MESEQFELFLVVITLYGLTKRKITLQKKVRSWGFSSFFIHVLNNLVTAESILTVFLFFDFAKFSVEMSSAYSQLSWPLNCSDSEIRVVLKREFFLNVQNYNALDKLKLNIQ